MFKLGRKLSPEESQRTFIEVNKKDHERPPHPWDVLDALYMAYIVQGLKCDGGALLP